MGWQGQSCCRHQSYKSPVYDPRGLEEGGIEYHKCPSVSKHPPTDNEVDALERLIEELRTPRSEDVEYTTEQSASAEQGDAKKLIALDYHYG